MSLRTIVRRTSILGGTAAAAVALTAGAANAHHCYIPMYSLNGPASAQWEVYTAADGAALLAGYTPECDAAAEAGYAALRDAALPVGIKINAARTIGDPQHDGVTNPNGANGKGMEYFGEGSTLADTMVMTWIEGAAAYEC